MERQMQKQRLALLCRNVFGILLLGFCYAVWIYMTGLYIPCPFRLLTGFKCPGCGISHCIIALLRGDLAAAFEENPFVLSISPALFLYALYRAKRYVLGKDARYQPWEILFLAILLLAAIAFGIWRNLPPVN